MQGGASVSTGIGERVPRKEDRRLLNGQAKFVGDLKFPRQWEAAFVRSPIAHGRIRAVTKPDDATDRVFTAAHSGKSVMIAPEPPGDPDAGIETGWTVRRVWEQKTQGYMSSPVLIDGHIYIHLKNERFACLEANTGDVQWTSQPFGKYWSMAYSGDKILALDSDGTLRLIRADPTSLEVIDQTRVADDAWAHLAVSGNRLIVRDLDALKAFRWDVSDRE